MHFQVASMARPIIIGSMHGLSDAYARRGLLSYAFVPLARCMHPDIVSSLFFASSVTHFSKDVGVFASLAMHAFWVACAYLQRWNVAWLSFCIFYCGYHVPMHLLDCCRQRQWLAPAACVAASLYPHFPQTLSVGRMEQAIVVSHILCSLVTRSNEN